MVRLESNEALNMNDAMSEQKNEKKADIVVLPKRSLSVEFFVGLFALISFGCMGYLAIGLGGLELGSSDKYYFEAEFDNVSGLEHGASVEIAGVKVGEVAEIKLEDPLAIVRMRLDRTIEVRDDDIFQIRTKGIIGDRYVKISRGVSDMKYKPEERTTNTESVIDIEDLIGKFVHNFGGDDEDEDKASSDDL